MIVSRSSSNYQPGREILRLKSGVENRRFRFESVAIDIIVMDDRSRLDIGLNLFNSRSSDHSSPLRHSISNNKIFFPKLCCLIVDRCVE